MELFYNPERMSETEIRETFVAHQWLVDEIVSILKRQPKGAGVQHAIIVAPRGMGKTTLLLMLRFTVLESDLARSWLPLLFPEESYDIYELVDFWFAVLNHLSTETGDVNLHQDISEVKEKYRSSRELEEAALARIKDWRSKNKKRLLLLVDSFDIILEQIGDERDNARLRDVLMNDGAMMLIGGATTFFKEARAYEQPLYNLFTIYNLQNLTTDQIHELLRRRARLDGAENFDETLRANATRIHVLKYFTGGNPRLVMMLYRVLTQSQVSEVKRGLEKLLDEVTPYYKAKVENLPAQQRKILDHIARITAHTREGLTPTEIATSTRLTTNQVSTQLQRLSEAGYVRPANIRGRSSYYTLSEPLYAIWHQMRFGRDARKRMEWLVTFLKGWYDSNELDSECQRLQNVFDEYVAAGRLREAQDILEHRRYLVSAMDSPVQQSRSVEAIILSYLELRDMDTLRREVLTDINPALLSRKTRFRLVASGLITHEQATVETPQKSSNNINHAEAAASIRLALLAIDNKNLEEAAISFRRAVKLDPTSRVGQIGLVLSLIGLENNDEALQVLKHAAPSFSNDRTMQLSIRGLAAALTGDFEGVTTNLNDLDAGPIVNAVWFGAGVVFYLNSQFTAALSVFSRLNELDPQNYHSWKFRAFTLSTLNHDEEALDSIDRALELSPDSADMHDFRGAILAKLNRHREALISFDRALQLDASLNQTWIAHGRSLFELGRYDEALVSFERACELQPASYDAFYLRTAALGLLGRYHEAKECVSHVLKIDPNSFDAHYLHGLLCLSSNDPEEAWEVFKRAFRINSGTHQTLRQTIEALSTKLKLSVIEEDFGTAKQAWRDLRERAEAKGGESLWLETASTVARDAARLGNWKLVRKLISSSDLDKPLFPLARALDYLSSGDERMIEKLSPEVRTIVEEIIDAINKYSSESGTKKSKHRNTFPKKPRSCRAKP